MNAVANEYFQWFSRNAQVPQLHVVSVQSHVTVPFRESMKGPVPETLARMRRGEGLWVCSEIVGESCPSVPRLNLLDGLFMGTSFGQSTCIVAQMSVI